MKYELAIAVADEQDTSPNDQYPNGAKRKKQGDIISVRPHPWNWGRKEIDQYLIVIINSDIDYEELRVELETNRTNPEDIKNKYKIDFTELKKLLPELDMEKVEDKNKIYQPFKKATQLVEKFDGIGANHALGTQFVDCGDDSEKEKDLPKTVSNLIYNKIDKNFKKIDEVISG